MKTIAVSDKAYSRLSSWKTARGDTFSAVIERLIPPKGVLGAALDAAKALPELSTRELESLESAVNATRQKINSTWK